MKTPGVAVEAMGFELGYLGSSSSFVTNQLIISFRESQIPHH